MPANSCSIILSTLLLSIIPLSIILCPFPPLKIVMDSILVRCFVMQNESHLTPALSVAHVEGPHSIHRRHIAFAIQLPALLRLRGVRHDLAPGVGWRMAMCRRCMECGAFDVTTANAGVRWLSLLQSQSIERVCVHNNFKRRNGHNDNR